MAQLVVALDVADGEQALRTVGMLHPLPLWYKIGLELFTAAGPEVVGNMASAGHSLFLDLKFHDIPNTVRGACRSAARLGVKMLTVHACGGKAMMQEAVRGRDEGMDRSGNRPLLLGITVLTSDAVAGEQAASLVVSRAQEARESGLDGIVCSGMEAAAVKKACGPSFICLCPGIRFAENAVADDQSRVCTPGQAVREGANFLVMGRPILRAESPRDAAQQALAEMALAEAQGRER